jgi:hypothetical protein
VLDFLGGIANLLILIRNPARRQCIDISIDEQLKD